MDRVSIIVYTHNDEKTLPKCVESLLVQQIEDMEVIIVSYASTDGSLHFLEKCCAEHKEFRLINISDDNRGKAKNIGLEASSGKYLFFMSGKDWIMDSALKQLTEEQHLSGSEVVASNYMRFDTESSIFYFHLTEADKATYMYDTDSWMQMIDLQQWNICKWFPDIRGKLFLKDLFQNVRFPETNSAEDDYTTYKAYLLADRIALVNDSLYVLRNDSLNISNQGEHSEDMPVRSIEEQITMLSLSGYHTESACRIYLQRLKNRQNLLLLEGKYEDYLREKTILNILEKYHCL